MISLTSTRPGSRWGLALVGLVTGALCLPFFRTVVSMADEGVLLLGAARMLGGSRLYVDFFEILPPGGFVLTEAWFGIAGISFGSARLLAVLTIIGIACFTFLACRLASGTPRLAAALTLGWVVTSQGSWTQVNHHWLTALFSMITVWGVLAGIAAPRPALRPALVAGAAAGAAAMVTPTCGALAMLAGATAFLGLRRQWPALIGYGLGCAVVPAGLLAYLMGQQALVAAFDDVIRFAAARYAAIQSVPFANGTWLQNFPLKYLFPAAAVLTLLIGARDWRGCLRDRSLTACIAFALAGFAGCFPRPDVAHIAFGAPLALPLLACGATRLSQPWRPAYRYAAAAVVMATCAPSLLAFAWVAEWVQGGEAVVSPRGRVSLVGMPAGEALLARIAATPAGDGYFFYPFMPLLPFLTAREHVSRYSVFTPGYALPSQYQDACLSVMRRASWVVIDDDARNPETLKLLFPALQNARPPETQRFEQALDEGFDLVAREGPFELRHRRDSANDSLCTGTAD